MNSKNINEKIKDDVKLIWLGTGTINSYDNYHTNALLVSDSGHTLLIDCGGDIRWSLKEAGYTYKDINSVYISHLHGDHAGGLEWLGFCTYFDPTCDKPNLYISEAIKDSLWENTLSGGMRSLQGKINNLETYFNVDTVHKNGSFYDFPIPDDILGSIEFKLVQVIHIMDGFSIVPSFGLLFEINGVKVFMTTDTQFCPAQINDFYNMADIIFHDCEITEYKSGVHANYQDLKTLPSNVKRKIGLVHFQDMNLPNATKDGFRGFVYKGRIFKFENGRIS